ncbi:MAG TPA: hypothetical protein VFV78_11570 [Vicinamibacterales bacterium]|nr:hypothetical protein [Vicinamibacterales bacterium]
MRALLFPNGLEPVSRSAALGVGAVFAGLMIAAARVGGIPILDLANLMFHEAGHRVFGWASYYTVLLGGTYGQLLVPLICTFIFLRRGETIAVAVCGFWFFENFLNIASYMADARRSEQPLVGGDESDWAILFNHWGVLHQDLAIAAWVRSIGWIGMLATLGWLAWMHVTRPAESRSR